MANRLNRGQAFKAIEFLKHRAENETTPVSFSKLAEIVSQQLGIKITGPNLTGLLKDLEEVGVARDELVSGTGRVAPLAQVFSRLDALEERVRELEELVGN